MAFCPAHAFLANHCDELLRVQASIVRDTKRGGLYRIPSRMTEQARAIYRAFDIERSITPSHIN